jgi:hypothetical protein
VLVRADRAAISGRRNRNERGRQLGLSHKR